MQSWPKKNPPRIVDKTLHKYYIVEKTKHTYAIVIFTLKWNEIKNYVFEAQLCANQSVRLKNAQQIAQFLFGAQFIFTPFILFSYGRMCQFVTMLYITTTIENLIESKFHSPWANKSEHTLKWWIRKNKPNTEWKKERTGSMNVQLGSMTSSRSYYINIQSNPEWNAQLHMSKAMRQYSACI